MTTPILCMALALALAAEDAANSPAEPIARLPHCLVSLVDDVQVPAQEPGVLVELKVREGDHIEQGMLLGRTDDSHAQAQRRVAIAEHQVAETRASSDINSRLAKATRDVAELEYQLNQQANQKVPGAKSRIELEKLQLAVHENDLRIEQADHETQIARQEALAAAARIEVVDDEIRRRRMLSPISGQVVEVYYQPGEWLQPGEAVLRIVRLDRLRIEAFLDTAQVAPTAVHGRPVEVSVELAGGRRESFAGRVVFVSPLVEAGGQYRVWAEVDNRQQDDQWLLRPGLEAEMTIRN